ncbi:MAG: hypothetical protein IJC25_00990 [Clostridia bacterium]|nr:hypothetical protein [Clostridia bacterium]
MEMKSMRSCPKCGYEYVYAEDTSCRKCGCRFDKSGEPIEAAPIETKTEPPKSTVLMPDKYRNQANYLASFNDSALFSNPGAKIKKVTQIVFWISCIACLILAIILFAQAAEYADSRYTQEEADLYTLWGFVTLLAGPLVSWISSLLLYAFGELVENSGRHC